MSATSPALPAETEARWDADIELPEARKNRPVTFMHKVESRLARMMLGWLGNMPVEKAARRLGGITETLGPMIQAVHKRGHENLMLVYPDMTAAERSAILRGVWRNLGMTVGEFAHLPEIGARVSILHEERLEPYIAGGQQAIFFSAHMANWEAMSIALYERGLKYAVVYRAANNPLVDAQIIERRAAAMSRRQIPKSKRGARDLVKSLNEGLSLCMLTDQKLNDGISAPLMGHPAMTTPAAARLSLKDNIPLVPLQLLREPGSRFTMTVHDPVTIEKTGDMKVDTQLLTEAMNDKLGQMILEHPDQWLWLHRRWPKKATG